MKQCARKGCLRTLTEFDVLFHQNLHGTKDLEGCKCSQCNNRQALYKAIYGKIPGLWLHIIPLLFDLLVILLFTNGFWDINSTLVIFSCIACLIINMVFGNILGKRLDIDNSRSVSGYTYTVSSSSNDSINVTRETNYSSSDLDDWVFFFFIICPFRLIYIVIKHIVEKIKFYSTCPPNVINAFRKTKAQCPFPFIKIKLKEYYRRNDDYGKEWNKISTKYRFAGEEEIKRRRAALPLPYSIIANRYLLVAISNSIKECYDNWHIGMWVLCKKADGTVTGKVIKAASDILGKKIISTLDFYYFNNNWKEEWKKGILHHPYYEDRDYNSWEPFRLTLKKGIIDQTIIEQFTDDTPAQLVKLFEEQLEMLEPCE